MECLGIDVDELSVQAERGVVEGGLDDQIPIGVAAALLSTGEPPPVGDVVTNPRN